MTLYKYILLFFSDRLCINRYFHRNIEVIEGPPARLQPESMSMSISDTTLQMNVSERIHRIAESTLPSDSYGTHVNVYIRYNSSNECI